MTEDSPQAVLAVIQALLGPDGCPWDKEQTPESLCDYILEETFELVDAVRRQATDETAEELGDVFFLLFFLSELLRSRGQIQDLHTVWRANAQKMKERHPHVFATEEIGSRDDLHRKWEEIKRREKGNMSSGEHVKSSLDSIPSSLPPLLRAYRLHAKAAKAGFTWDSTRDQEAALGREWEELQQAKAQGDPTALEEEFGDVLFSLVEYGRRHGIKANAALHQANLKFIHRLERMLEVAGERGLDWDTIGMEDKERLWQEIKSDGLCSGNTKREE